jgi:allophanate hydrolase subunit 1
LHDRRRRPTKIGPGSALFFAKNLLKKLLKTLRLSPLGDGAVYAEFGDTLDLELNRSLQALAVALRARALPWIRDVVPALCGIALHFDPFHPELPAPVLEYCRALLEDCFDSASKFEDSGRTVEVPVCYDVELGLDLTEVSERTSFSIDEIIRRHVKTRTGC